MAQSAGDERGDRAKLQCAGWAGPAIVFVVLLTCVGGFASGRLWGPSGSLAAIALSSAALGACLMFPGDQWDPAGRWFRWVGGPVLTWSLATFTFWGVARLAPQFILHLPSLLIVVTIVGIFVWLLGGVASRMVGELWRTARQKAMRREWRRLFEIKPAYVPSSPGVYLVSWEGHCLHRLLQCDREGILYVGLALRGGLRGEIERLAEGPGETGEGPHEVWRRLGEFGLLTQIPPPELTLFWEETDRPEERWAELVADYVRQFGEPPPLNN